jgi:hypothetical protein
VLNPEQRLAMLIRDHGSSFDLGAGSRLLSQLRQRSQEASISGQLTANILEVELPLTGYHSLAVQLVPQLSEMMMDFKKPRGTPDVYKRTADILQMAAAPGMGKTTAATAMWAVLHHLCTSGNVLVHTLGDDGVNRIKTSFTPSKFLVFSLDLSDGGCHCTAGHHNSSQSVSATGCLCGHTCMFECMPTPPMLQIHLSCKEWLQKVINRL